MSAETHYNLGKELSKLGRHEEAIASYQRALALKPDFTEVHNNLGVVADRTGPECGSGCELSESGGPQTGFRRLSFQPRLCPRQSRPPEEAIASYQRALELDPDSAETHHNLGNALHDVSSGMRKPSPVIERALAIKPDFAQAHYNLGLALYRLKRHGEAAANYQKALALKPDFAESHNNLGIALGALRRHEEAVASYQRALELEPDFAQAHNNRAIALGALNRHGEAIEGYRRALALQPDLAEAHGNLSYSLLSRVTSSAAGNNTNGAGLRMILSRNATLSNRRGAGPKTCRAKRSCCTTSRVSATRCNS